MGAMARGIRWTLSSRRCHRTDPQDLLHDVVLTLIERGPESLAGWDPSKGTLECFFRVVASGLARSFLRSGRRSGWAEIPSEDAIQQATSSACLEDALVARDSLARSFGRVRDARTRAILEAIYVDGRRLDEVCETWSMSVNAVYCTQKRFRALVQEESASDALRDMPPGGRPSSVDARMAGRLGSER